MHFLVTITFFSIAEKNCFYLPLHQLANLFLLLFLNTKFFTFHHSSGWERQFPMFSFYIYQFHVKNRQVRTNVKHSKEHINGASFDMSARFKPPPSRSILILINYILVVILLQHCSIECNYKFVEHEQLCGIIRLKT